jgi:predicted deacetylase
MLDHNFLVMLARILSFGLKGQHMENGRRIAWWYYREVGRWAARCKVDRISSRIRDQNVLVMLAQQLC